MDKHRLFPNLSNREHEKIHTSEIAISQSTKLPTPYDVHLAKHCSNANGLSALKHILVSVQAIQQPRFQEGQRLDEVLLLEKQDIKTRAEQLLQLQLTLFNIIPEENHLLLDKLLTDAISLGERLGEHNERVDALLPIQNDKKYKSDRKAGAAIKHQKYDDPIRELVKKVVHRVEKDPRMHLVPKHILANAIYQLVLTKQQHCNRPSTLEKYIKNAYSSKPFGGRPPKNAPNKEEVISWLNQHFPDLSPKKQSTNTKTN